MKKNQGNLERRKKEKERSEKNSQEKSIEIEILKTELERERTKKEKWDSKYLKLKEQFTSVEMQSEVVDSASLSSIPPPSEGVKQLSFYEGVSQDEKCL